MSTDPIHELLLRHRLVAVLRLDDLSHAEPLVEALLEAGVRVMEFTLTNPEALPVIRRLSKRIETFSDGSAALGVGSVMSVGQARASLTAGAQFVVTPVVERDVIRYCDGNGVPIFPGALTPTEIHTARLAGARIVKLFPAGRMGPDYVRDLLAPFPEFELMPTGGVGLDNLGRFLGNGAVAVGVGNNLIDASALAAGDWAAVSRHATKFVEAAEAA